jgi:hypothetical protein
VTYQEIGHNPSIAEGLTFNSRYLVSELLGYQHWTRLSAWTVVAALVSVFLIGATALLRVSRLRKLIVFLWGAALIPGALGGLMLALDGAIVLILGLLHQNNYKPSMALLYLLWVTCLWLLPWLGDNIVRQSQQIFP